MKKRILSFLAAAAVLLPILTGCEVSEEPRGGETSFSSSSVGTVSAPSEPADSSDPILSIPTSSSGTSSFSNMSSSPSKSSSSSMSSSPSKSSSSSMSSSSSRSSYSSRSSSSSSSPSPSGSGYDNLPLIDFNSDEFIEYPTAKSDFKDIRSVCMYDFGTAMSTGIGYNDYALPVEAHYGLTAYISGTKIYFKAYNNTNERLTVKSSSLENFDANNGQSVDFDIGFDYIYLDVGNFINGLFGFNAEFSNGKTVRIFFYVNGSDIRLCRVEKLFAADIKKYRKRRSDLNKFISDNSITPSKYLDVGEIYYPYPALYNWHCDTQAWVDLSNTLVNESWSDERKLCTFVEWICNNIAYDYFKYNVTGESRPHYYNDFSGKYSTYSTHIGVCVDFAEILDIMCRAHDIPALAVNSDEKNHSWNLVYINGHWMEIDITPYVKYGAYTESLTDRRQITLPKGSDTGKMFGVIPHSYDELPKDVYISKNTSMEFFIEPAA